MFATPQNILYVVISACILVITVFLCWMFYYVMRILKNANRIIEEFRLRLQAMTEAINYIRGKVEHISGLMTLATEGVGGLVKKVVGRKARDWMDGVSEKFDNSAKEAVDHAVEATAKKMKKMASNVKKTEV